MFAEGAFNFIFQQLLGSGIDRRGQMSLMQVIASFFLCEELNKGREWSLNY